VAARKEINMAEIAETAPAQEVDRDAAAEKAPDPRRHYASPEDLRALMERTDQMAEIHNTLRAGTPVTFTGFELMAG
jgi:hypothetical protein